MNAWAMAQESPVPVSRGSGREKKDQVPSVYFKDPVVQRRPCACTKCSPSDIEAQNQASTWLTRWAFLQAWGLDGYQ